MKWFKAFQSVSLGLTLVLAGCASQQKTTVVENTEKSIQPKAASVSAQTPEELAYHIVDFLNGQDISNLKSLIVEGYSWLDARKDLAALPADSRSKFSRPEIIHQMLSQMAQIQDGEYWYFNQCKGHDLSSSTYCSISYTDWQVAPLELSVRRGAEGQYQIFSVINHSIGSSDSDTAQWALELTRLFLKTAPADIFHISTNAKKVASEVYSLSPEKYDRLIQSFPIEVQHSKGLRLLGLTNALQFADDARSLFYLEPLMRDSAVQKSPVMEMNYHMLKSNFEQVEQSLDKLDSSLGITHFSLFQRANVSIYEQDYARVLHYSIPLIREQPYIATGYVYALIGLVGMGEFEDAANLGALAAEEFEVELTRGLFEELLVLNEDDHNFGQQAQIFLNSPELDKALH